MSSVLCGILLVLHVNITSSVCYPMVLDFHLFSCCRQQKEEEREKEGERGGAQPGMPESPSKLLIPVLLCPHGTVL